MKDFGHWDYAEAFTGREAAHLIAGLDPSLANLEAEYKVRPIVIRMKKAYYQFVRTLVFDIDKGAGTFVNGDTDHFIDINPIKRRKPEAGALWSVEIEDLVKEYNTEYSAAGVPEDLEFCNADRATVTLAQAAKHNEKRLSEENEETNAHWRDVIYGFEKPLFDWAHGDIHEFDDQKFSRLELHRWISENNYPSVYAFSPRVQGAEKPVSTHERNTLLVLIAALCAKAGIDPKERGVAGQLVRLAETELGVVLDDGTVLDKLRQIPDAVGARQR